MERFDVPLTIDSIFDSFIYSLPSHTVIQKSRDLSTRNLHTCVCDFSSRNIHTCVYYSLNQKEVFDVPLTIHSLPLHTKVI
jgi:hypothetical protein